MWIRLIISDSDTLRELSESLTYWITRLTYISDFFCYNDLFMGSCVGVFPFQCTDMSSLCLGHVTTFCIGFCKWILNGGKQKSWLWQQVILLFYLMCEQFEVTSCESIHQNCVSLKKYIIEDFSSRFYREGLDVCTHKC